MVATLMDTRSTAAAMREQIKTSVQELQASGIQPTVVIIAVSEDTSIYDYIKVVTRNAAQVGVRAFAHILPINIPIEEMRAHLAELNQNPNIHGISLQTPLPVHLPVNVVSSFIDPTKDVEGLHPDNLGLGVLNNTALVSPPALAGMKLLSLYSVNVAGSHVVVLGRNPLIGKSLANLLTNADATVTVCHRKTNRLAMFTRSADILITAVQRPQFVTGEMIRPGCVVIDYGINYVQNRVVGDVNLASVQQVASAVTPMPSGTGPMTVIHLLKNVIQAAQNQQARPA